MEIKAPIIVVGHYGSGKTEFVLNLARRYVHSGEKVVVGDMDIVNPYFRARELKTKFKDEGIEIISSNLEQEYNVDTPAMAASLKTCFEPNEVVNIMDVGGDPSGANVLARYAGLLKHRPYHMWMVVNANRPKTSTVAGVMEYLEMIQQKSKLTINGFINNTHLLRDTKIADILRGEALAKQLMKDTGLPIIFTAYPKMLEELIDKDQLSGEPFPMDLLVMPDWI